MKPFLLVCFALTFAATANGQNLRLTQIIAVSGKKMAYQSNALQSRKPGEPVVVFEGGLGSGKETFDYLLPLLPESLAWITYDRAGLSQSEADTCVKTDSDVIKRLHQFLAAIEVAPPYILVGHSLGGAFIRLFTNYYPSEVTGLVFIDPTNFMLGQKEDKQIKTASGGAMGYKELFLRMNEKFSNDGSVPAHVRQEMKRVCESMRKGFFYEYSSMNPLPDIPVVVLIAYNSPIELQEEQLAKAFKINSASWFAAVNKFRIRDYAEMIKNNRNSSVVLLPGYQHVIHHRDPQLVATTILQVYKNALKTE